MSVAVEILKNNYEGKEGSLIYFLHEECTFNKSAFWDYYNCIIDLTNDSLNQSDLDRELSIMLSETYAEIITNLLWHFHPQNLYTITDVPKNKLNLYIERLGTAYTGFFKGIVLKEELYDEDLINPRYK